MIDVKEFARAASAHYMSEFDGFWRWKLEVETKKDHILDDAHRREACRRLWTILRGWQAYRPSDSTVCLRILEDSLGKMADAYNQIRSYSLLEFDEVPNKPLELVWHDLGRVKEDDGKRDLYGYYYIVSLSKHLMFLWGQTLAFDSKVRARIPWPYNAPKGNRWCLEDWKRTIRSFQEDLRRDRETLDAFNRESLRRYGTSFIVPYGRFLDMYYHWEFRPRAGADDGG